MRRASYLPLLAVLLLVPGCGPDTDRQLRDNKAIVKRFTELTNDAEWERLSDVVAVDFKRYSAATSGEPVKSLSEFITLQTGFLATFPDQRVEIDHMIAEGDHVAVRATYSATQSGPMGTLPATGKTVSSPFIAFFRIESGKIAELWVEWDNVALLTQLGLFPPPGLNE